MPLNRFFKNLFQKYSKKFLVRGCKKSPYMRDSAWDTPPYVVSVYVQIHRRGFFDLTWFEKHGITKLRLLSQDIKL